MGGQKAVLEAMRFSPSDPEIKAFLEAYDGVPKGDRERLPWEAVALSAGINVSHLLGAIHVAVQQHSVSRVKFITVMGHPLIAAARVRFGQLPSGEKDRHAIDTATGFLPSPKPPTFIGKAIFGATSSTATAEDDDDGDTPPLTAGFEDDFDYLFPRSDDMQGKIIGIRQKLLEK